MDKLDILMVDIQQRLSAAEQRLGLLDDLTVMPMALNIAHNLCSDVELGFSGTQRTSESSIAKIESNVEAFYVILFGQLDYETLLQSIRNDRHAEIHTPLRLIQAVKRLRSSPQTLVHINNQNPFLVQIINQAHILITVVLSVGVVSLCRQRLQTVEKQIAQEDEERRKRKKKRRRYSNRPPLTAEEKHRMRTLDYDCVAAKLANELKSFRNCAYFSGQPFLTDDVLNKIELDLGTSTFPVPDAKYNMRADERTSFLDAIKEWHETPELRQCNVPLHPECSTILLLSNLLLGIADSADLKKDISQRPVAHVRLSRKSQTAEKIGIGKHNIPTGPTSQQFKTLMSSSNLTVILKG